MTDSGHYLLEVGSFGKPIDEQLSAFMQKNVAFRLHNFPSWSYGKGKGKGKGKDTGKRVPSHSFLSFSVDDNPNAVNNVWAHAAPDGLDLKNMAHRSSR